MDNLEGDVDEEQLHRDLHSTMETTLTEDNDEIWALYRRRTAWWDSTIARSWFQSKGYTLYDWLHEDDDTCPIYMYPRDAQLENEPSTSFPYAYTGEESLSGKRIWPLFTASVGGRGEVAFATDSEGRHVALKVMKDGSNECQIHQFLQSQGVPTSIDNFQSVMPVLDFFPLSSYWFSVVPRWGNAPNRPAARTIRETFKYIHCLLKGLAFLHQHKIVHRDIKADNILVNHYGNSAYEFSSFARSSLRFHDKLTYAFFDFDAAIMFPMSYTAAQCRLSYEKSNNYYYDQVPSDTLHGEPDYDPFAFDVGMLGVMFCQEYQHLAIQAPMLAPLFDRMTTRNILQRFTALEAFQFFEKEVYHLTTELALSAFPAQKQIQCAFDYYDRWQGLDPSFTKAWAMYREPPVSHGHRFLRWICRYPWAYRTIACIRTIIRQVTGLN